MSFAASPRRPMLTLRLFVAFFGRPVSALERSRVDMDTVLLKAGDAGAVMVENTAELGEAGIDASGLMGRKGVE